MILILKIIIIMIKMKVIINMIKFIIVFFTFSGLDFFTVAVHEIGIFFLKTNSLKYLDIFFN